MKHGNKRPIRCYDRNNCINYKFEKIMRKE